MTALSIISSTPPGTPNNYNDNIDATHPAYLDFVLAKGIKPNFAKLSFKLRNYRTYNSFSASSTGTDASGESGHSHSHSHTTPVSNNNFTDTVKIAAGSFGNTSGSSFNVATTTDATGSSGHSHSHNHTISGSSFLGVTEGASTTITNIAIDGTDITAALGGGPWASDIVDLDLTALMPTGSGAWHTLTLTPSGLGRLVAILRLG